MARVAMTDDYYSLLEVSQFADSESIRDAYKRLALKLHPDKNKDASATSDFQRLAIAWETLKDGGKRAEYDRSYVRIAKRKRETEAREDLAERSRRRKEEVDREVNNQWARATPSESSPVSADELARREKARAWQAVAREDYLSRLQTWIEVRNHHLLLVSTRRQTLRKLELDLEAQSIEDEAEVTARFQDAIQRSCSSGQPIQDQAGTLSKLLEARESYAARLASAVVEARKQLDGSILELEKHGRRYEEDEERARRRRVGRALEFLGPRNLNPPLFSMIDRRGRAINSWKALSRIKPATKFTSSLDVRNEGPWHRDGTWARVVGESTCGRCDQRAFHLIPECGPATCPGCGMTVCHDCYRSLRLLREYEIWVTSPGGVMVDDSLFSVVFDPDVIPTEFWAGTPGFGGAFDTSHI